MLKRRERPSALLSVGGRFLRIWGCACGCSVFGGALCLYPLRVNFFERISTPVVMSNPQADRVRDIAKLRTRAARTKKGQFLVEGPQAVREVLKAHLKKPILDGCLRYGGGF